MVAALKGKLSWMKEDRRIQNKKRDMCYTYVKVIHSELPLGLHKIEFDNSDREIREKVDKIIQSKYETQLMKLNNLIENKLKIKEINTNLSNHQFFKRFIFLTETNFTIDEAALLEKGFKHNIYPKHHTSKFEQLAIDTEICLRNVENNSSLKHLTASVIRKEHLKKLNKPKLFFI
ncbi:hypothetical protein HHI36_008456 [Cryptolaemus montrouzieri]|uniref:Uncharacterized protein n=1 Tax=Cryptolaemus montrouzieri TaxID=559131 RepID=A0ABD2MSF6_9CUCU